MATEIERKFLLDKYPTVSLNKMPADIKQGYIALGLTEIRIRETVNRYWSEKKKRYRPRRRFYLTIKTGKGMIRGETEFQITAAVFRKMWPLTLGQRVIKNRSVHKDWNGLRWEIDVYDSGLITVEVELASAEVSIEIPEGLKHHIVKEITGDPTYSNQRLAK